MEIMFLMLDPMLTTPAIHAMPCPSLAESFLWKLNFKVPARVLRVAACARRGATSPQKAKLNPQWILDTLIRTVLFASHAWIYTWGFPSVHELTSIPAPVAI